MPTMRRNPAGGVIDTTGMGRGAGIVRPPIGMPAFRRGGVIRGYQGGGEVDDEYAERNLPEEAGLRDIGRGPGVNIFNPLDPDTSGRGPTPMPQDPRMLAYKNQQSGQLAQQAWNRQPSLQPQQTVQTGRNEVRSIPAASGWLSDKLHGAVSPGLNTRASTRRPVIEPEYAGGGYVDDEGLEDQGADDAMIDPMQQIYGALSYGRKKYGIPSDDNQGEMGFDDGGVVPTQDEQAQGNPNAIDPRQAMAYLSGDGAVSPEIAQALEQSVDPQGQLDPTQRAMAAIGVAPNDEAKFGLLQYYRTKYNGFSAAAKAAMQQGDMGEAAHQASLAMDSVPNGKRTQFAPAPGGLAMVSRPAFGQGGGKPRQPAQQAFDDGGVVEDDEAVMSRLQPQPQADPPDVPADAPTEDVPVQEPLTGPAPMPVQSQAPATQVLPAPTVMEMLSKGFDDQLANMWLGPLRRPEGASAGGNTGSPEQRLTAAQVVHGPQPTADQVGVDPAQLENLRQNQRQAVTNPNAPPIPHQPYPDEYQAAQAVPDMYPDEYQAAQAVPDKVTAPVTRPPAQQGVIPEGAVIDEDRVNPFTGQVRAAVPGTFGSREAARRAGTTVPRDETEARGAAGPGVIPTGAEGANPSKREAPNPRAQAALDHARGMLNDPEYRAKYGQPSTFGSGDRYGSPMRGQPSTWSNPPGYGPSGEHFTREELRAAFNQAESEAGINRGGGAKDPRAQRFEELQREAGQAYPQLGADKAKRDAYVQKGMIDFDAHQQATDVAGVRARTAEQTLADKMSGASRLEDQKAKNKSDLQTQKDAAALTRKQSGQEAALNLAAAKGKLAAASSADRERLRLLGGMMRDDPSLVHDPGKLLNLASPIMQSTSLKPEELLHAASVAFAGGKEPAPAASTGDAAARGKYPEGVEVGTSVPKNTSAGPKNYILGPDGKTMWREDVYKKKFGG